MNPAGGWLIPLTLLGAMLLAVAHLPASVPDWLRWLRPDWAVATFFFWAVAAPRRIGLVWAWSIGLLFDVLLGEPLGLNGFGFALATAIGTRIHARWAMCAMAQRAAVVLVVAAMVQVVDGLFCAAFASRALSWQMLIPALTTMLVYPLLEYGLQPLVYRFVRP